MRRRWRRASCLLCNVRWDVRARHDFVSGNHISLALEIVIIDDALGDEVRLRIYCTV